SPLPAPLDGRPPPGASSFAICELEPMTEQSVQGRLHRTDTVDYIVMLAGELTMAMAGGEKVVLHAGDCVVQGGAVHAWINTSDPPARFCAVLVGADRAETA